MRRTAPIVLLSVAVLPGNRRLQDDSLVRPYPAEECPSGAGWNALQRPVHLFGNPYSLGTRGLASLLVASPDGHALTSGCHDA